MRVLAPAGYGKTSLVARWATIDRREVRWVDLGREHDDPVAMFAALRDALSGVFEIAYPTAAHASAADPYVRALEDALATAGATMPFLLVLDDVHRVRSAGANGLLATVVERVPSHSTVVFVGRGHHDGGSIGRMRLVPGVIDVAVDDLAFDDSEAHRLFESIGCDPRLPATADLLRQLEGWPAGIRLAGEVVCSGAHLEHVAESVGLVDYLRGEWTGQLDEHDLAFLREAACLGRLSGSACDEVLGRHGSDQLLRRLHRDEVVVFALDERDGIYRMHGLLRTWLAADLKSVNPGRWSEVHQSAAQYCERHGDVDGAVAHARAAGDLDLLERLVTTHGGAYFTRGLDATVERWLDNFPAGHVRGSPGLAGIQCVKALHRGDDGEALQWLRVLDQVCRGRPKESPADWWRDVLHAALDERPAATLIPGVAEARAHLAGGPWAGFACWVHGALCFLDGDVGTARSALEAGVFEGRLGGNQLIVGHCNGTLSMIDDYEGDEVSASTHARLAGEAVAACGAELLTPAAPAMAAVALEHARRNEREAAHRTVAAVRRRLLRYRTIAPWFNVVARLALLRTALLLDDRVTATSVMRELEHHARFEPPAGERDQPSAIAFARDLRARVEAMHRPATGSSALTDAELRVLHLLPTNLSLADIATRLYISRNTVKSHVASIYRKLDAVKRADAVDRARSAGLLPTHPVS